MTNNELLLSLLALPILGGSFALTAKFAGTSKTKQKSSKAVNHSAVAEPIAKKDNGWLTISCEDLDSFMSWLGKDSIGLPPSDDEEHSLGSHLLVELYGCRSDLLEREDYVGGAMRQAAEESKATVVAQSFHEFKPYGVSGAVIIQESHYTIHTWPEHRYAAVDLFYCGGTVRVDEALKAIAQRFRPERMKFIVVRRGLDSAINPVG